MPELFDKITAEELALNSSPVSASLVSTLFLIQYLTLLMLTVPLLLLLCLTGAGDCPVHARMPGTVATPDNKQGNLLALQKGAVWHHCFSAEDQHLHAIPRGTAKPDRQHK